MRRVAKRHAWTAVLTALFALPVLRPQGFPGVEGFFDGVLSAPARAGLGGPSLSRTAAPDEPGRALDLERLLLEGRERYYAQAEAFAQRVPLADLSSDLSRLPRPVFAQVLRSRDASPSRRSILIDRGSSDAVVEGLAVAQGGTFLGLVRHAERRTALVQLVTDPASRLEVAVRTQEGERTVGWMHGAGAELPRVRHLRRRAGATVRVGDPVFTSNADERVPAGLLVGVVESVGDVNGDGNLDVRVRPRLDLERSTTVLVVLPSN